MFAPDGYNADRPRPMGRQAAGLGFLRAAVNARGEGPLLGYGDKGHAAAFDEMVRGLDPSATTRWIGSTDFGALGEAAVCYRPDPVIAMEARLRLHAGPARYALCGVTHTTASAGGMDALSGLLREPVMPWDAVICTSSAVAATVRELHAAQTDYLRWRHGPEARTASIMLPVIPLGVHCDDFVFSDDDRRQARAQLDATPETFVALFVGRLVHHAKAHPAAMFQALATVARRTGQPIKLVLCGWFPSPDMEAAFQQAATMFGPGVSIVAVNGGDAAMRKTAWAAADTFVSLADNIQETFGLTPIEAMAAGLPCVVTDWDGYRDTVRDGIDGFRIPTWAPEPGVGAAAALEYEAGLINYNVYCWRMAAAVAVDAEMLADRLETLVRDPDLRRKIGEAARARARAQFDWSQVFAQYQALWGEQDARRRAALANPDEAAWLHTAPTVDARHMDPTLAFAGYPTHHIGPNTPVVLRPGMSLPAYEEVIGATVFNGLYGGVRLVGAMWPELAQGPTTVARLATATGYGLHTATLVVGSLAKMGFVSLG